MELKMYEFEGDIKTWICAESQERAINLFQDYYDKEFWQETIELYDDEAVREMDQDEIFTYYHDGMNGEEDTISNLIDKYCDKPEMFAISEF